MTQKQIKLIRRGYQLQNKIEKLKEAYKEIDSVTLELKKAGVTAAKVGKVEFILVDNFMKQNTAFRTTSIRRYEGIFRKEMR